jgi:hypothetical protein
MEVHYSRLYRYLIIALGVVNILVGLTPGNTISLIVGVLFIALGGIALSRVYLRVEPNVIILYALIGPFKREFPYTSPADVTVAGNRLLIQSGGTTRAISAPRWMVDQIEWARLQDNFLKKTDVR